MGTTENEELKGQLGRLLEGNSLQQIVGCLGDLCESEANEYERLKADEETVERFRSDAQVLWGAAAELSGDEDNREGAQD